MWCKCTHESHNCINMAMPNELCSLSCWFCSLLCLSLSLSLSRRLPNIIKHLLLQMHKMNWIQCHLGGVEWRAQCLQVSGRVGATWHDKYSDWVSQRKVATVFRDLIETPNQTINFPFECIFLLHFGCQNCKAIWKWRAVDAWKANSPELDWWSTDYNSRRSGPGTTATPPLTFELFLSHGTGHIFGHFQCTKTITWHAVRRSKRICFLFPVTLKASKLQTSMSRNKVRCQWTI